MEKGQITNFIIAIVSVAIALLTFLLVFWGSFPRYSPFNVSIEQKALNGDINAQLYLGNLAYNRRLYYDSYDWFLLASKSTCDKGAIALNNIGYLYSKYYLDSNQRDSSVSNEIEALEFYTRSRELGNVYAIINVLALLQNGNDLMFSGYNRNNLLIEAKIIYEDYFGEIIDLEQFYSGWVFVESYKSTSPMSTYTTDIERLVSNGTTSENHSISSPLGITYYNYSLYRRAANPRNELIEQYNPISENAFPIILKNY